MSKPRRASQESSMPSINAEVMEWIKSTVEHWLDEEKLKAIPARKQHGIVKYIWDAVAVASRRPDPVPVPDSSKTSSNFEMCMSAFAKGDFSEVLDCMYQPKTQFILPPKTQQRIRNAWKTPYIGNNDDLFYNNLQKMQKQNSSTTEKLYLNHASIIQSSGSGKSRLVDEVSKRIFTIPVNLRADSETIQGAFPFPDAEMRNLLTSRPALEEYLFLLSVIFDQAITEIASVELSQTPCEMEDFAKAWYDHIETRRDDFYMNVKTEAESKPHALDLDSMITLAREKLESLIDAILRQVLDASNCRSKIVVLLSFDEAHVLAALPVGNDGKFPLDVLVSAINELRGQPLFAILMSTQSKMEHLAPSSSIARSARYRSSVPHMHAPITETPFDCFEKPLIPSQLNVDVISDPVFMALFGRPLWRSMLLDYVPEVITQTTKNTGQQAEFTSSPSRTAAWKDVIRLARTKLILEDPECSLQKCTDTGKAAVLDVLLMFTFEPSRMAARQHELDLVASHMRTVYSIPTHREYLRSGYSSEGILAEASFAQTLYWMEERPDAALAILEDNLRHDLLDRGKIGDLVGRLLLILARLSAYETVHKGASPCSMAIPVIAFIEALFEEGIAVEILDSAPDNVVEGATFREAYKDAVVNFTHFSKWADDSAPTQDALLACFIRSTAAICRNSAKTIDAVIPMVLDCNEPITANNISAFLIQFTRRNRAGAKNAYAIDEEPLGIFPPGDSDNRPYVTIVMELGTTSEESALVHTATNHKSKDKTTFLQQQHPSPKTSTSHIDLEDKELDMDIDSPLHVDISVSPEKTSERHQPPHPHPRYGISVYGCTNTMYRVIEPAERERYKAILQLGGLLSEHARQDVESLWHVRKQKPWFSVGPAAFDWVDIPGLQ